MAITIIIGSCALAASVQQDPTVPSKPASPKNPLKPMTPGSTPGSNPGLSGPKKTGDQLVKVNLSANTPEISPGEKFSLAFLFEIEPHWHIYWKNPGSSGAPTEIKVKAPKGFVVGPTLFPRPAAFVEEEGATYGYEDKISLFVEVTAPQDLPAGTVMFNASINWLVCREVCLMGRTTKVLTLSAKGQPGGGRLGGPPKGSAAEDSKPTANASFQDPFIQQCWHRLPVPLKDQPGAEVTFDKKNLAIKMPSQSLREASFFPIDCPGVSYGEIKIAAHGDHLIMTIPVEINPQNAEGKPPITAGMIALGKGLDDPCFEFELPLTTP